MDVAGCKKTITNGIAAIVQNGTIVFDQLFSAITLFLLKKYAANITKVIFKNSDGWKENPPKLTHLSAVASSMPNPGTLVSNKRKTLPIKNKSENFFKNFKSIKYKIKKATSPTTSPLKNWSFTKKNGSPNFLLPATMDALLKYKKPETTNVPNTIQNSLFIAFDIQWIKYYLTYQLLYLSFFQNC